MLINSLEAGCFVESLVLISKERIFYAQNRFHGFKSPLSFFLVSLTGGGGSFLS